MFAHRGQPERALTAPNGGGIGHPQPVRFGGGEVALHQIRRRSGASTRGSRRACRWSACRRVRRHRSRPGGSSSATPRDAPRAARPTSGSSVWDPTPDTAARPALSTHRGTSSVLLRMTPSGPVGPHSELSEKAGNLIEISPVVRPFAYSDSTISSTPVNRRCRFFAICGSKLPSRSRGTSIGTGPVVSANTVFGLARIRASKRNTAAPGRPSPRCRTVPRIRPGW